VSEPLNIDASLKRRADARERSGEGSSADRGESAWDLPEQDVPDGSQPDVDGPVWAAPAAEDPAASSPPGRYKDPRDDEPRPPPAFPSLPGLGDDAEDEPAGPGFDIMRYARGVWQRKWIVATIGIVVSILFLFLALSLPRQWRATATLISETHQDAFQVSDVPPFRPQDYELQTFIDTIKLPSSLDETMQRTGINVLRRTMAGAISVGIGRDSKLFSISATWEDPQTAARIANTVAELFLDNAAAIRRQDTEQTFDEYSIQLHEARAAMAQVNAEVLAYEEEHRIASLDDQLMVLVAQVSELDAEFRTKTAEAGAMRAALKRIQQQMAEEPEMVVAISRYRSPFKQRLSDYQWELKEARTRYTDENPKIKRIQKRIETLEQLIAESNDEVAPENEYRLNPKREELSLRAQQLEDDIKVIEAQAGAVKQTLDESRDNLNNLTAARTGYQDVRAKLDESDQLVDKLAARLAEVRVVLARNESGFSILERATPPTFPEPSMRKLVAAAGVVVGGGLGLFVALVLEFLDPVIRRRRDVVDLCAIDRVWEFQRVPPGEHSVIDTRAPAEPVAMWFRRLVNEVTTGLDEADWRLLGVSSAEPSAGRSLVATNLAQALALKERQVILVDSDLRSDAGRRPADLFDLPSGRAGLGDALRGNAEVADLLSPTETRGLQLLGPGGASAETGEHARDALVPLGTGSMRRVVEDLAGTGRNVIFDLPPLSAEETVLEAAAAIGSLVLVARSGHTRRDDLKQLAAMLRERNIEIRVVLLTDVPADLLAGRPAFEEAGKRWSRRMTPSTRDESLEPVVRVDG
jgi:uncharacterized protein involved in exopolysaccharide biosynthesis/Mrp family chromosome partitioning ATPase